MTEKAGIWVGLLDLDETGPVAGVDGPVRSDHGQARVLVRMHRAPLGHVYLPARPVETLTTRARIAAETTLAGALGEHAHCDDAAGSPAGSPSWAVRTACPRYFPTRDAGMTIVVCTRDRTESLCASLRALQRVTYDPIEILVVDNAPSGDATRDAVTGLAADDPRIRYVREVRPGLARARNHGLAHARFELVAFTDDDTTPDPGWPSALAAGFAADAGVVCVTGLVASAALNTGAERYFDARILWQDVLEPRRYDLAVHRHPSRLYPLRAGLFGTGANFAVRRDAVARLGGFDPLLGAGSPGRGGEDLDMFLRLVLAGGRICYLPSAVVWHRHRADPESLREQMYSYGHGLGAYLVKHLTNRDLHHVLAGHSAQRGRPLLRRMRRAARESHLGPAGRRLVLTEARGLVAGALRYPRVARQASRSSGPQ
ncbi:MAG: glycosyltransferase [Actinobacteria bacterium]|nr:glycosyltransferase [Actinomycetota bacterium]